MSEQTIKTEKNQLLPKYFYLFAVLALLWNLMGVAAFVMQILMTAENIAALKPAEQALYNNTPIWATIAFAVAVIGGSFGCLLLLMKKALAQAVLMLSLFGILVQMFHSFFISNSFEVFGPGGTIMPIMVLVIAIALIRWTKALIAKEILI
jgi:hypothetical protein